MSEVQEEEGSSQNAADYYRMLEPDATVDVRHLRRQLPEVAERIFQAGASPVAGDRKDTVSGVNVDSHEVVSDDELHFLAGNAADELRALLQHEGVVPLGGNTNDRGEEEEGEVMGDNTSNYLATMGQYSIYPLLFLQNNLPPAAETGLMPAAEVTMSGAPSKVGEREPQAKTKTKAKARENSLSKLDHADYFAGIRSLLMQKPVATPSSGKSWSSLLLQVHREQVCAIAAQRASSFRTFPLAYAACVGGVHQWVDAILPAAQVRTERWIRHAQPVTTSRLTEEMETKLGSIVLKHAQILSSQSSAASSQSVSSTHPAGTAFPARLFDAQPIGQSLQTAPAVPWSRLDPSMLADRLTTSVPSHLWPPPSSASASAPTPASCEATLIMSENALQALLQCQGPCFEYEMLLPVEVRQMEGKEEGKEEGKVMMTKRRLIYVGDPLLPTKQTVRQWTNLAIEAALLEVSEHGNEHEHEKATGNANGNGNGWNAHQWWIEDIPLIIGWWNYPVGLGHVQLTPQPEVLTLHAAMKTWLSIFIRGMSALPLATYTPAPTQHDSLHLHQQRMISLADLYPADESAPMKLQQQSGSSLAARAVWPIWKAARLLKALPPGSYTLRHLPGADNLQVWTAPETMGTWVPEERTGEEMVPPNLRGDNAPPPLEGGAAGERRGHLAPPDVRDYIPQPWPHQTPWLAPGEEAWIPFTRKSHKHAAPLRHRSSRGNKNKNKKAKPS
jgi:hypothetical protein